MKKHRQTFGVAGWIPTARVDELEANAKGGVTMSLEPDDERFTIKVDGAGIEEVRVGSSKGDKTLVQLIIDNEKRVDVNFKPKVPDGFSTFRDPVLANLSQQSIVTVIMA